jgi:hypothetical protein
LSSGSCWLSELPECIFKNWIHSREEDTEGISVYRPSNFKFPPSRGRVGFEVKKSGEFIQYAIGRDDRPKKEFGHYKVIESKRLYVSFDELQVKTFTLQILMCDDYVLRVEKIN